MDNSDNVLDKIKQIFESAIPKDLPGEYPKEAMPLGTIARSLRMDRLGIITDAFYGDLDKDNQKIIVYTLLLLPPPSNSFASKYKNQSEKYYLSNEYEYEVIGYLMLKPVNVEKLFSIVGEGMFL
jgi:hypothetical protein